MPRKEWIPKNPCCRRSRLNEDEFRLLVLVYFSEAVGGYPRKASYTGFNYLCDVLVLGKYKYFSQQALSNYFRKISQYIWDNFIVGLHPLFQKDDVLDDLLKIIYGKTGRISPYKELDDIFNSFPLFIDEENVTRSLMFELLSLRSKVMRGFKSDKFYLEFSRVFFICAVIETKKFQLMSVYSTKEEELFSEISNLSTDMLFYYFSEKGPM